MALYDQEYIDQLPNLDGWGVPLVAFVAKEATPKHAFVKQSLSEWYLRIPEAEKLAVFNDLREQNDETFISRLHELYVAAFCSAYGAIRFAAPLPDGRKPDILWEIDGVTALVDVVTIFDENETREEKAAVKLLLRYLGQVEHHFHLFLEYEAIDPVNLKPSRIKEKVVAFLDSLDPEIVESRDLEISGDGLIGTFTAVPRKDPHSRKPIAFGLMEPMRQVFPVNGIKGRIRKKIRKYKDHDGPVLVALCRGGSLGVEWDDVATVLYGPTELCVNPKTHEKRWQIGDGGLIMPSRQHKLSARNTSLTGVLYCTLSWRPEQPTLDLLYLSNPFSKHRLDLPMPTYPSVEDNRVYFRWSNIGEAGIDLGVH